MVDDRTIYGGLYDPIMTRVGTGYSYSGNTRITGVTVPETFFWVDDANRPSVSGSVFDYVGGSYTLRLDERWTKYRFNYWDGGSFEYYAQEPINTYEHPRYAGVRVPGTSTPVTDNRIVKLPVHVSLPIKPPYASTGGWSVETVKASIAGIANPRVRAGYSREPHPAAMTPIQAPDPQIGEHGYVTLSIYGDAIEGSPIAVSNVRITGVPLARETDAVREIAAPAENHRSIEDYGPHTQTIRFHLSHFDAVALAEYLVGYEPAAFKRLSGIIDQYSSQLLYHWPFDIVDYGLAPHTIEQMRLSRRKGSPVEYRTLIRPV